MTKQTLTMMAGALALALGTGAVQANDQAVNNERQDRTTSTTTTTSSSTSAQSKDTHGQMVGDVSKQNRDLKAASKVEFSTLDTNADGYILISDLDDDSPLKTHFATYDTNSDNRLSRTEYESWLSVSGGMQPRDFASIDTNNDGFIVVTDLEAGSPLVESFATYDLDNDNRLSRTEYDAWIAATVTDTSSASQVAQTRRDFNELDTDNDGKLSDAELRLSDATVADNMTMYDRDGDGMLSETEYRDMSLAGADIDEDFDTDIDTDTSLDSDLDLGEEEED